MMQGGDLDDDDELERDEESERRRGLYLRKVEELNLQLAGWHGGYVVVASYSFGPAHSRFTTTEEDSILELQISKRGEEGKARVRCIACWRVHFLALWINSGIQASYQDEGLANLVLSDGRRLRVECKDAVLVTI